jgi:hypothetical protein
LLADLLRLREAVAGALAPGVVGAVGVVVWPLLTGALSGWITMASPRRTARSMEDVISAAAMVPPGRIRSV